MGKSAQAASLAATSKNQAKARALAKKTASKKPVRVGPENWQVWAGQRCCPPPSKDRFDVLRLLDAIQAAVIKGDKGDGDLRHVTEDAEDRGLISGSEAYVYRVAYTTDFWCRVENYVLDPRKTVVRSGVFDPTYVGYDYAQRLGVRFCSSGGDHVPRHLPSGGTVAAFSPADRLVFEGKEDGEPIALFERTSGPDTIPTFYVGYSV